MLGVVVVTLQVFNDGRSVFFLLAIQLKLEIDFGRLTIKPEAFYHLTMNHLHLVIESGLNCVFADKWQRPACVS
jgi:hypothetical protein